MPSSSSTSTGPVAAVPTVAALPPRKDMHPDSCPAFPTEDDREAYAAAIAPRRELVCPITQEPYRDPVIAEDGHTYERTSILRWFHLGRTRSPVTNDYLAGKRLVPNRAVGAMALSHRERLGNELVRRCGHIRRRGGVCGDGGDRLDALLDAGADPSIRDSTPSLGKGETCLHHLIKSDRIDLVQIVLRHDAPVLVVDDDGETVADAASKAALEAPNHETRQGYGSAAEWSDLADELHRRADLEKEKLEAKERARARSNEEHRERQRGLAADAREAGRNAVGGAGAGTNAMGLGSLEEGWGYFPCLAALQFQQSVPPPSPSVADWERKEKRRLDVVLRSVACAAALYLLLC